MLRRVWAICLLITLLLAPLLVSASGAVVPYDHWLYSHFARLYFDGLLPEYPAELISASRKLTRYEMAFYLKGLLERLEVKQSCAQSCDARQMLLVEECLVELKKELLALGVSIRSLEEISHQARNIGLDVGENPDSNYLDNDYLALSALTEPVQIGSVSGGKDAGVPYLFSSMAPISYGLQREIELHIADPMVTVSAVPSPAGRVTEAAQPEAQQESVVQEAGFTSVDFNRTSFLRQYITINASVRTGFRTVYPSSKTVDGPGTWAISAGAGSSMGLVSSVALTNTYGTQHFDALSIGGDSGADQDHELSLGSAAAQSSTQDFDMTLEIGRFAVSTNTPAGSIFRGIGVTGNAYGSLGLRTRYEYTQFGTLTQEPVSAAVAIEGKLVLGTATLYGGYGYSAVRQSVAEQFNLSQSITNAGINFRLSPDIQLFAEYVILASTQPWNQRQAVVGLQHSDLGSFMFGYRLLSLADSQLLASFSLKF
ncbi:MAG TPA: hypothetical protein DCX37_08210 [Firmicutes bacterium]|jgi:hypothetical protein|nr:hypothetical protein [Bacillota bacterium]HBL49861.1 hypothetical protein [Bacillota bacterium]HCT37684.1 hypothetical protein [Bacillota bacterium]